MPTKKNKKKETTRLSRNEKERQKSRRVIIIAIIYGVVIGFISGTLIVNQIEVVSFFGVLGYDFTTSIITISATLIPLIIAIFISRRSNGKKSQSKRKS